jgi:hypothetical protein
METKTAGRDRDYKHEYEVRRKRIKRLHADLKKETADAIQEHLRKRGLSFIKWLEIQIDNELKDA